MNIILAAGLCSLLILVYSLRLMADGRKLEKGLLEKRPGFGGPVQEEEELLIKDDYSTWMSVPFGATGAVGSACQVEILGKDSNS